MKNTLVYLLLFISFQFLSACPIYEELDHSYYDPVYMSRAQLESSIQMKPPQKLVYPGKIYRYGSYLLINEKYKGVHIINNANPAMPEQLGFLQVPGNIDFAVKRQVLYVDNAVDLVAVNLQDLQHITVAKRIKDAFPPLTPPDGRARFVSSAMAPADAVIVAWELKTTN